MPNPNEQGTKIAYLQMLDESALMERISIRRMGSWDGELPEAKIAGAVKTDRSSNCVELQAKGSLAAYNVLEGLLACEPFGDGVLIGGTQYLPIAAFSGRMYGPVQDRMAEVLAPYDRIIARVFEKGVIRGPRGLIGDFQVEFYTPEMSWCGYGHMGDVFVEWEVLADGVDTDSEQEAEAGTPEAPVTLHGG